MLTEQQITDIMNELQLDATDVSARTVIKRLAASKPDAPIDARFIASLREELQAKARTVQSKQSTNNFNTTFMNKILASALIVVVALVAGGVWYTQRNNIDTALFSFNQSGQNSVDEDNQILSGKYGVKGVAEESFGDLNTVAIAPTSARGGDSVAMGMAGNNAVGAPPVGTESQKMMVGGDALISPLPSTNFTYKYDGGTLPTVTTSQSVFKRTKPDQPASLVSRIIGMISFGLIDMNKFQDVKFQSLSFMEDREYGYGINVDIQNGNVSMYQNWEKWPQNPGMCYAAEGCPPPSPIRMDQLPSDTEAIAIADQFLADYSISKEGYGTPIIQDSWRIYYERAADKRSYYIPEQVQVVYPLLLENQQVYDEGGMSSGMSIMVDARTKRVVGLSELTTKQYEKSDYIGETDAKRLLTVAERGGFRNYVFTEPGVKKTTLNLDTPTVQMVKIWYSSDNYRTSSELFVPAFVFPIKNWESAGYYRSNVIVPLVRDILDSDNQQQGQPIPLDAGPATSQPEVGIPGPATGGSAPGMSSQE